MTGVVLPRRVVGHGVESDPCEHVKGRVVVNQWVVFVSWWAVIHDTLLIALYNVMIIDVSYRVWLV